MTKVLNIMCTHQTTMPYFLNVLLNHLPATENDLH